MTGFKEGDRVEHKDNKPGYVGTVRAVYVTDACVQWDSRAQAEWVDGEHLYLSAGTTAAEPDPVNHPSHYTAHPSGVECIQITRHMNFNCGNAMKYLWRADLKHDDGGIEDLRKAMFYVRDEIERREASANSAGTEQP